MAIFRKSKKTDVSVEDSRARAETIANQSKWDELERLVNGQAAQSDLPENETPPLDVNFIETDPPELPAKPSSQSLDMLAHDLREIEADTYTSGLKINMAEDTKFVDVTPTEPEIEPQPVVPAPAITAMLPSEHFETELPYRPAEELENPQDDRFFSPSPTSDRRDRADIATMRLDVARITADIQSGEELYRRAQQRIQNLTNFVEQAEIDFSMLNRLEPENRRLKARNHTIEREFEANIQKMHVLQSDLEDRELRLAEKTRVYSDLLEKITIAQKTVQEYEHALNEARESSDQNALKSDRIQTALDVEHRENEILRKRLTDTVNEMEAKQTNYIEARKIADSLAQDCSDFREQAQGAKKESSSLRKNLATVQTQNNAMKVEMLGLHEEIRSFKTQSHITLISREDQVSALQQQVNQLNKQLEIKDEILQNGTRDIQALRKVRTAQDLERERLEAQIQSQTTRLEQATLDILKSKQDATNLDEKYHEIAAALSVTQSRQMSNKSSDTPDIQPASTEKVSKV